MEHLQQRKSGFYSKIDLSNYSEIRDYLRDISQNNQENSSNIIDIKALLKGIKDSGLEVDQSKVISTIEALREDTKELEQITRESKDIKQETSVVKTATEDSNIISFESLINRTLTSIESRLNEVQLAEIQKSRLDQETLSNNIIELSNSIDAKAENRNTSLISKLGTMFSDLTQNLISSIRGFLSSPAEDQKEKKQAEIIVLPQVTKENPNNIIDLRNIHSKLDQQLEILDSIDSKIPDDLVDESTKKERNLTRLGDIDKSTSRESLRRSSKNSPLDNLLGSMKGLQSVLPEVFTSFITKISTLATKFMASAPVVITSAVLNIITRVPELILDTFASIIGTLWGLWDSVVLVFDNLMELKWFKNFIEYYKKGLSLYLEFYIGQFKAIGKGITLAIDGIKAFFTVATKKIIDLLNKIPGVNIEYPDFVKNYIQKKEEKEAEEQAQIRKQNRETLERQVNVFKTEIRSSLEKEFKMSLPEESKDSLVAQTQLASAVATNNSIVNSSKNISENQMQMMSMSEKSISTLTQGITVNVENTIMNETPRISKSSKDQHF